MSYIPNILSSSSTDIMLLSFTLCLHVSITVCTTVLWRWPSLRLILGPNCRSIFSASSWPLTTANINGVCSWDVGKLTLLPEMSTDYISNSIVLTWIQNIIQWEQVRGIRCLHNIPNLQSSRTQSTWPSDRAWCKGVYPDLSKSFRTAPHAMRRAMFTLCPAILYK